jgi:hypothetical protein
MPGKHITKKQVEIYMQSRKYGFIQKIASAKAGISERSGRAIEHGKRKPYRMRNWRTRPDPFSGIFETELMPLLVTTPDLSPITLLEYLQEQYPNKYPDYLLRTLQRRVKKWKCLYGPEKEVMFRQTHEPGRLALSDFTELKNIVVTIQGKESNHLLYHFRLAYSHWSYMKIILGGESFTALTEGLQEALWRLGGAPYEHRTDSLSAAFKNLSVNQEEDLTKKYKDFCSHYNMKPSRNNVGESHENGSVEAPHGHLKRRIHQALLLRGNNDFNSVDEYQKFIEKVVSQHNNRNAKPINIEKENLQLLPIYKTTDYTELCARVTSSSTINVRNVTYTVPSRLEGEMLRIHLYDNQLQCYLGSDLVITLPRVHAKGTRRSRLVNYKHVIGSLIKKPQAFLYSQIRDDLLPNENYKEIWKYATNTMPSKMACKFIVGLLYLAAEKNCEAELATEVLNSIDKGLNINLRMIQNKYSPPKADIPLVEVNQHLINDYNELLITGEYYV